MDQGFELEQLHRGVDEGPTQINSGRGHPLIGPRANPRVPQSILISARVPRPPVPRRFSPLS